MRRVPSRPSETGAALGSTTGSAFPAPAAALAMMAAIALFLPAPLAAQPAGGAAAYPPVSLFAPGIDPAGPGLVGPDGTAHEIPEPPAAERSLNILDFGARPDDMSFDNAPAFASAIAAASAGDEIYVPEGRYRFRTFIPSSSFAHVTIAKDGVSIRGAGRGLSVLVSDAMDEIDRFPTKHTSVVMVQGADSVRLSGFSIVSTALIDYDWRLSGNNPSRDGPKYGVRVKSDAAGRGSTRVLIEGLSVERFQRMGIRIETSRDVVVRGCRISDATDLGGGGAGYGIVVQGLERRDLRGTGQDPCHVAVVGNEIAGPRLRHAVLLQYMAHNCLVADNAIREIQLGAIDLHGEGEHHNEVARNLVERVYRGGGIELGNTGAGHAASGSGNWIHHNEVRDSRDGIVVDLGSAGTIVEHNTIERVGGGPVARGIALIDADRSVARGNRILSVRASGGKGYGILVGYRAYPEADPAEGLTSDSTVEGNEVGDCDVGLRIEAAERLSVQGNSFSGNGADLADGRSSFRLPPRDGDRPDLAASRAYLPLEDSYVSTEDRTADFSADTRIKVKTDRSDPTKNRVSYLYFDLEDRPPEIQAAWLRLTGKIGSTAARVDLAVYLLDDYEDWREGSLTWENSVGHDERLSRAASGLLVGRFSMSITGAERSYFLDAMPLVRAMRDGRFTLMIVNETEDPDGEEYVDIYSRERGRAEHRPSIFLK